MFEWFADLPKWLKYGVSFGFILVSTLLYFAAGLIWPWGWAAGLVLLIASSVISDE